METRQNTLYAVIANAVVLIGLLVTLLPLAWLVLSSFKEPSEVLSASLNPIPNNPTLANYINVYEKSPVLRQLANSVIFAGGVTLGQLAISIPAAYAFARTRSRLANGIFSALLLTLPIPFVVYYVPNYLLLSKLGLLDTFAGLILPQLANAYALFLIRQHFSAFPKSILEAARLDGCREAGVLFRIVVPSSRGPIAAAAVYIFIMTWNEYVWPLLVASSPETQVIQVSVAQFASSEGGTAWGSILAAASIASVPTILLYMILRRQVISAFIESAVKG